ncbi:hypothetical protein Bca52824_014130 [Brassica carinata]|uniref:Uncharacterized protein n=1 Tax=Brassica carinata TaxID=52824 RepID=A0A8X8B441_BRACI|nr:hypothetical protein Bca52824_014130 [Brassica carinata]
MLPLGLPCGEEESVSTSECPEDKDDVTRILGDMQLCDARAVFDLYFPNSWFRRTSSPGK